MTQDSFYAQIKQGPALLLLGQNYLGLDTGADSFLSEILHKYGVVSDNPPHYNQIFEGRAQDDIDAALAWMYSRSEHFPVPQWLQIVASFPWSGVYTSAIDAIWPKAFETDWRNLQPLIDNRFKPNNPRNRSNMVATFLFGCINRIEELERPPLTMREWSRRRLVAISLISRLPEILTPFGTLLIEGYSGKSDWLTFDDLLPIIDELNAKQAHIFSVRGKLEDDLVQHPYVSALVKEGKLILHDESLAMCLLKGEEAGYLKLGEKPEEENSGRHIRLEKNVVLTVPAETWNQVSRSAIILDDAISIPLSPISAEKRYHEFREFLSESSNRPVWSAYNRGLAFVRNFERELYSQVRKRLESRDLQQEPVILHGQSGTGKTVALGALAYKIRNEQRYPVLFIERRTQRPLNSDIDAFCKWAEDCGASACLVIWDGMVDIEQYYDLLQYLVGRGRKVVLVGSYYRIEDQHRKNLIEANATLSSNEVGEFDKFLKNFNLSIKAKDGEKQGKRNKTTDDTFLVALYHLLPPTRPRITTGLAKEVGLSEQRLRQLVQEEMPEPVFETTLAYAFYKVGLIELGTFNLSNKEELAGEEVNEIQKLIGLVMVPGSFGLKVPIELLLRVLDKQGIMNFVNLLNKLDIFRWYEDEVGNISIGPRHPLEARLVMQARLGGASFEVTYVQQLLLGIQDSGEYYNNPEIQFAVDLLRSMRPDERLGAEGRFANRYIPYFRDLAETLGRLREEHSVQNPRLILQETTFLREAVRERDKTGNRYPDTEELLDKAEANIRQALNHLEGDRQNSKLESAILVELASLIGTRIRHILDYSDRPQDAKMLFDEVVTRVFKAQALEAENYYPIDVLAWVTIDLINKGELQPYERASVVANILHTFERADVEDFSFYQQERLQMRRMSIGKLLDNTTLSDEAFEALISLGSSAGYYLRAYQQAGFKPEELAASEMDETQRQLCRTAAEYLEHNREYISGDGRCLYLLLRLWWLAKTGKPIFYSERQTLPFTKEDWRYCRSIILNLIDAGEAYTTPAIKYLFGLATFQLDDIEESFDIFKELEREADYVQGRRRIVRSYLASMANGKPRVFKGIVRWVDLERNRGDLYVEELRRAVRFLPFDFNRPDIRQHESINFHLAFNFLGPIADPISYFKTLQEKF